MKDFITKWRQIGELYGAVDYKMCLDDLEQLVKAKEGQIDAEIKYWENYVSNADGRMFDIDMAKRYNRLNTWKRARQYILGVSE